MPERTPGGGGPVLLCYDGSDHARGAIETAGRELGPGRKALVVTVWEPFSALAFGHVPAPHGGESKRGDGWESIDQQVRGDAEAAIAEGVEFAKQHGFDAEPVLEQGVPVWERILEIAKERRASMIVVGSHGRSGLGQALLGSVAASISRHAGCTVVIVPVGRS